MAKQTIQTSKTQIEVMDNQQLTQELIEDIGLSDTENTETEIENYSDTEAEEITDDDDDDEEEINIVYAEIEKLKSLCSQSGLTYPMLLTYADLDGFDGIQKHIRLIEERLGVPQREPDKDVFIKISANKDGFQGFRYPEVGLVDGVICAIFHNHIQPIENVLKTCKTFKVQKQGDGTSAEYSLTLGEDQAEYLPMRISVKPSDQTYNVFQMVRVKYLQSVCANYTFSRTWLSDGTYRVSDIRSIDGRFLIGIIDGRQYYLSQSQFDNLKINEQDGRPQNLIIDGNRTYVKDGNTISIRNEYIEGHRPGMFFSECMETIFRELTKNGHFGELTMDNPHAFVQIYLSHVSNGDEEPKLVELLTTDLVIYDAANSAKAGKTEKKSKARRAFKVEPPVEIRVKGITSCKPHPTVNRWGFQLLLESEGVPYTTIPNSAIAENKNNRLFENVNFNDDANQVKLIITEIEYWEQTKTINGQEAITINKKYVLKWHTPLKAQQHEAKYSGLAAKLSKQS